MPELAKCYGLLFEDDARTIERALDRLIAAFPGETLRLLEVGIDQGHTACGIQTWLTVKGLPFEYWGVQSGRAAEPFEGAHLIVGDSTEVWHHVPGEMHFAFIDACQNENHVILDFFNYSPKLRVGGLMLFHHTTPHTSFRDCQLHGPNIQKFHINCRHALKRIGLIQGRFLGWTLIEDTWTEGEDCGGVCVFRKQADMLALDVQEGTEEVQLRAVPEPADAARRDATTAPFSAPPTPSGRHRLHVVTAVSRPKNLPRLYESLSIAKERNRFDLLWHLVIDTSAITPTPGLLRYIKNLKSAHLHHSSEVSQGNRGGPPKNTALDAIVE